MGVTAGVGPGLPGPEAWRSRGGRSAGPERLAWLDALRGAALLGMVAYHGAWDLHAYGLIETDPSGTAGWLVLGHGVAALFLLISGFGLSLALRQKASPRRMWLRLGRIALAAALVTAATLWAVPQAPVWFGILHCIVVANALALAVRSAPTAGLMIAAAAACAAAVGLRGALGPGWAWTGLAGADPVTVDFRPVLPWLAPVLVGMALGRAYDPERRPPSLRYVRGLRPLSWAGRRSLLVYLLHQPVLLGLLVLVVGVMPREDPAVAVLRQAGEAKAFLQQCRSTCMAEGGEPDLCASACHCVLTATLGRPNAPRTGWTVPADRVPHPPAAEAALCRRTPAPSDR